eukprot:174679-Chlamydomonas_euryale.AAC.1
MPSGRRHMHPGGGRMPPDGRHMHPGGERMHPGGRHMHPGGGHMLIGRGHMHPGRCQRGNNLVVRNAGLRGWSVEGMTVERQ